MSATFSPTPFALRAADGYRVPGTAVELLPQYVPPKTDRKDVPEGANLCEYCPAKCCQYFALPIETPETREDFDYIRWYMYHGRVQIFVDDGTWFLMVLNACDNLLPDNRCGVYETRPKICGDYSTKNCEYDGDGIYDLYFELPEQIAEYADSVLALGE